MEKKCDNIQYFVIELLTYAYKILEFVIIKNKNVLNVTTNTQQNTVIQHGSKHNNF